MKKSLLLATLLAAALVACATQQYTVHDNPPPVTRPKQLMAPKTPN